MANIFKPKVAYWIIAFILVAAVVCIAWPYFTAKEQQPKESILSLAETLREQANELEGLIRHKQARLTKTPRHTEAIDAVSKRETEIRQAMQQTVGVYRGKLRQEMTRYHELEAQVKQLSRNDAERRLRQGQIDALRQNQINILFWLNRSVQEAPPCYCVSSDVKIFLSGR